MLVCVVALFLLCWGPRFVLEFLLKLHLESFFTPTVYWIRVGVFLLPFLHAIINPFIYLVMCKNIREAVLSMVSHGLLLVVKHM